MEDVIVRPAGDHRPACDTDDVYLVCIDQLGEINSAAGVSLDIFQIPTGLFQAPEFHNIIGPGT